MIKKRVFSIEIKKQISRLFNKTDRPTNKMQRYLNQITKKSLKEKSARKRCDNQSFYLHGQEKLI